MYIETSYGSSGDNAKLQFPVPRNKSTCCLVFYYHMYGWAMGTLNVYNGNNKAFSRSGNQGNYWYKVRRTLYSPDRVSSWLLLNTRAYKTAVLEAVPISPRHILTQLR